jgi:hypothetical protein
LKVFILQAGQFFLQTGKLKGFLSQHRKIPAKLKWQQWFPEKLAMLSGETGSKEL